MPKIIWPTVSAKSIWVTLENDQKKYKKKKEKRVY